MTRLIDLALYTIAFMAFTFDIRPWQAQALNAFNENQHRDFLCVATPGAGKTTFALVAARQALAERHDISRVVVVVPSAHLREQWADAAARLGLILDTAHDDLSTHSHGCVTTYQSVASKPDVFRSWADSAFVIFDEIHHAGDDKTWGEALLAAFSPAPQRLSLSGTPFRSDTTAIPFVRYRGDELEIDYEYGYAQALKDGGVVRPVHFTRLDGHMEWIDTDGEFNAFSFAESLNTSRVQQRLNAALDPKGNWLSNAIARAHAHLQYVRRNEPSAGGLVICVDHAHAKTVASLLRKLGTQPTIVLSDDNDASKKILEYAKSDSEWIVAVRMVSEGVDIPRLSVGLFATSTTTELFFRQAVGRIVRMSKKASTAMMFIPNDPRIVAHAHNMAESRVHSLKKDDVVEDDFEPLMPAFDSVEDAGDEQLSMFQVVNSTPLLRDDEVVTATSGFSTQSVENANTLFAPISIELPPLPSDNIIGLDDPHMAITTMKKTRAKLRQQNNDRVRTIAGLTGESHAHINSQLNKKAGLPSIAKATNEQLEKRKQIASDWVVSLRKKRVS
jgi:superfamily II DNA or RNA helicase